MPPRQRRASEDNQRIGCLPIVNFVISGMKSFFCCFPTLQSKDKSTLYQFQFSNGYLNHLFEANETVEAPPKKAKVEKLPPTSENSAAYEYFSPHGLPPPPYHNEYCFVRERRRISLNKTSPGDGEPSVLRSHRMGGGRSRIVQDNVEHPLMFKPEKRQKRCHRVLVRNSNPSGAESLKNDSFHCVSCLSNNLRGKSRRNTDGAVPVEYPRIRRCSAYDIAYTGAAVVESSLKDRRCQPAGDKRSSYTCEVCQYRNRCRAAADGPIPVKLIGSGANSAFTPVTGRRHSKLKRVRSEGHSKRPSAVICNGNAADDEMDSDDQLTAFEKYRENFLKFMYPVSHLSSLQQQQKKSAVVSNNGTSDSSGIGVESVYSLLGAENNTDAYNSSVLQPLSVADIELDSQVRTSASSSSSRKSHFPCTTAKSYNGIPPVVNVCNHKRDNSSPQLVVGSRTDEYFSSGKQKRREYFKPRPIKTVPVNSFLSMSCYQETVL